jgi:hypothetical protein
MRWTYDVEIYEKLFRKMNEILFKYLEIKRDIDEIPKNHIVYRYIFSYMSRSELRDLKKTVKELDKKADALDCIIKGMKNRFEGFISSELSS